MKNNVQHDTLIYIGSSVLNALIPFLLLPILTRYLSPAEFGVIALFLAVVTVLNVFVGIGLHGSIRVRFFKNKEENFPRYVGVCILILIISACLTMLFGIVFFKELVGITGLSSFYLGIAFTISITQFLIQIRLVIWQVRGYSLRYGIFQVLQTLLNALFSLYFIIELSQGVQGRVLGIGLASVLFCLFAITTLFAKKEAILTWNKADAVSALKFGIPLMPHALTGIVIAMSDRFILANIIGMDSVGVYFIALQLSLPVGILSESISRAFMPWSFNKMGKGEHISVVSASYLLMMFFVMVTVIYAICIWFGYDLLIDVKYHDGMKITLILLLASCFQAFYFPVARSVIFSEKTLYLSILTVCLGAIYLVSAIEVVGQFGMQGLAITYLLYRIIVFFFVWVLGNYLYPMPWLSFKKIFIETCQLITTVLPRFQKNPDLNNIKDSKVR